MDAARADSDFSSASEKQLPVTQTKWWMRWRDWPRKRQYIWLAVGLSCLALVGLAIGLGVHFGLPNSGSPPRPPPVGNAAGTGLSTSNTVVKGPVVDSNFADPCYITENGVHYSFATNKYKERQAGQINIQLAKSNDFHNWTLSENDALPIVGNWSAGDFVWAPSVAKLDNGSFIMYYSARKAGSQKRLHCVGAAYSDNVEGPYTPLAQTLACPLSQGGAIDPSAFRDADGKRYYVYKIDGNSFTHPGGPAHPTPLMLQQVAADGVTSIGSPIQLLDRQASDGPLVEAPALGRYDLGNGTQPIYVLYFSSNVFTGPHYNVLYATSTDVQGPYTRGTNPLLTTGDGGGKLVGPGGMDVGDSSQQVVFHSIRQQEANASLARTLWVGNITIKGDVVTL